MHETLTFYLSENISSKKWCDDMLPGYNVLCSIVTRMLCNTAVLLVFKLIQTLRRKALYLNERCKIRYKHQTC